MVKKQKLKISFSKRTLLYLKTNLIDWKIYGHLPQFSRNFNNNDIRTTIIIKIISHKIHYFIKWLSLRLYISLNYSEISILTIVDEYISHETLYTLKITMNNIY